MLSSNFITEELRSHSPHEIGQNSIIGLVRELPDSGKVELQTHRSSLDCFTHPAHRATTVTIFESSRVSSVCMDDTSQVGNMTSASAYQSIFGISPTTLSPITDNVSWKSDDLSRPLSPTPISESPMRYPESPRPTESASLFRWLETFFPDKAVSLQFLNELGLEDRRRSDAIPSVSEILIQPQKSTSKWIRQPQPMNE